MAYEVRHGYTLRAYYREENGKPIRETEEMFFDFLAEAEQEAEKCRQDPDIVDVELVEDYAELWFPDEC